MSLDKGLLRRRIAFIRQGSETERFHTKRCVQKNDVGHHSFHVAMLADLIASAQPLRYSEIERYRLVKAGLEHDLAEHIVGDMPGDAKRELGIREQFHKYEEERFVEVGMGAEVMLTPSLRRILKVADMMDGAFFCIAEASLGNARFGSVFENFRNYLDGYAPFSEAEEIIIEYIDELWAMYGDNNPVKMWGKSAHKKAEE